jgi:hypothetical protein
MGSRSDRGRCETVNVVYYQCETFVIVYKTLMHKHIIWNPGSQWLSPTMYNRSEGIYTTLP